MPKVWMAEVRAIARKTGRPISRIFGDGLMIQLKKERAILELTATE
jgi:hypothetical protein